MNLYLNYIQISHFHIFFVFFLPYNFFLVQNTNIHTSSQRYRQKKSLLQLRNQKINDKEIYLSKKTK